MTTLTPDQVKNLLMQALPAGSTVAVQDLTGTQDHYKVVVVSEVFTGKTLLERHQVVNAALAEPLKGPIHALTIEAYTTAQWQAKQQQNLSAQGPTGIKF